MEVEDQTTGLIVMQVPHECDLQQCDDLGEVKKKKDQSDSNIILRYEVYKGDKRDLVSALCECMLFTEIRALQILKDLGFFFRNNKLEMSPRYPVENWIGSK